jgi:hypothetical protein
MASVRAQILSAVTAKLEAVQADLGWKATLRNPRESLGEDQFNAIVQMDGGDREPIGLTGHAEQDTLEFSVAWFVMEAGGDSAEDLLDAGFVAIADALLDPADIQLGGLAIGIARGAISDPGIGRSAKGARIIGAQSMDFTVQYLAREGDASTPGP